jgi:preprotein translocase subunit SecG
MANENFPAIITNQTNTKAIWHFLFLTPVFLYHVIDNGDSAKVNTKSKVKKRIIVSSVLSTGILFVGLCLVLYVWKKKQQKNSKYSHHQNLSIPIAPLLDHQIARLFFFLKTI